MIEDSDIQEFINQDSGLAARAKAAARTRRAKTDQEAEEARFQLVQDTRVFLRDELGISEPDVMAMDYEVEDVSQTKFKFKMTFKIAGLQFYSHHITEVIWKKVSMQFNDENVTDNVLQVYVKMRRGWRTFKTLDELGEILLEDE
jgi:hypothetical protein